MSEHFLLNGSPGSSTLGDKNTEQHSANRREWRTESTEVYFFMWVLAYKEKKMFTLS